MNQDQLKRKYMLKIINCKSRYLKHFNGLGGKDESVGEEIVSENSYAVDAVSGATIACEVIKNAVNKALTSAK